MRARDCVGRYGGDQFAVVCSHTLPEEALVIAQRIRESISALRFPGLAPLRLTTSVGLVPCQAQAPHLA